MSIGFQRSPRRFHDPISHLKKDSLAIEKGCNDEKVLFHCNAKVDKTLQLEKGKNHKLSLENWDLLSDPPFITEGQKMSWEFHRDYYHSS